MPYRVNRRRFIGLFIVLSAFLWVYIGIRGFTSIFVETNTGGAGTQLFLLELILAQIAVLIGSLLLSLQKKE